MTGHQIAASILAADIPRPGEPVDTNLGVRATYVIVHPEVSDHIDHNLPLFRGRSCEAGLLFNPAPL